MKLSPAKRSLTCVADLGGAAGGVARRWTRIQTSVAPNTAQPAACTEYASVALPAASSSPAKAGPTTDASSNAVADQALACTRSGPSTSRGSSVETAGE